MSIEFEDNTEPSLVFHIDPEETVKFIEAFETSITTLTNFQDGFSFMSLALVDQELFQQTMKLVVAGLLLYYKGKGWDDKFLSNLNEETISQILQSSYSPKGTLQ